MKTTKFTKSAFKKAIIDEYGSVAKMKKHLKDIAIDEYGCFYSEVKVFGCKIVYTSNTNCWASFIVNIPSVGLSSQLALGKSSITKAGKQRGCFNENFFITL